MSHSVSLFVLRPVATSTYSRSSISGLNTKRLISTLIDTIYYFGPKLLGMEPHVFFYHDAVVKERTNKIVLHGFIIF
jgi:hypothetical protein